MTHPPAAFFCQQSAVRKTLVKLGKVFLFRVENLSKVFRGKFISSLQKKYPQEKSFIRQLYKTSWVVYTKEPFA